ncbi:crotonase/enoyl-CoA hydratase family protein [Aureimonas pseudogalii]|uniref:Enoyl-CoA hydratase/carnithine racemase n=1 Tax=Aureimonas pseudogalii TaxID=1744844 RepID=A0A7W6MK71_9HYPH|nr:crotonase/enoyl-CoA hydratase family protein [Aureimonas pseudogalii]MBB3998848.1 enoyl-CoA hydratase/carnithine racemase [Aureimonas pseudogalii]
MSKHVETAFADGVMTLRLVRPEKRNAIDRAMYAAMADALRRAGDDADIRAVLIAGVPGAFSAGNDLMDFVAFGKGGPMDEVQDFLLALVACEKPLVAAVDGLAVGIGTTLLLHCDLVYATPRSTFRTPFVDLGLVPEAASSLLAPRQMGTQNAFALLAMGETFDSGAALAARLVYAVTAEAEAEARSAAQRLAAKPPEALRLTRALMRGERSEIETRIRGEIDHFTDRLRSTEARSAFAAFFQRG